MKRPVIKRSLLITGVEFQGMLDNNGWRTNWLESQQNELHSGDSALETFTKANNLSRCRKGSGESSRIIRSLRDWEKFPSKPTESHTIEE